MADSADSVSAFIGTFYQSMDVKGRMTFPAKLRECFGERFIITRGTGECLSVYTKEAFAVLVDKIRRLPMSPAKETYQRALVSNATEVEPDKQGRILIPGNLRNLAKLDKEVVVTGVIDRCEIWDQQKWDSFNDNIDMGELLVSLEGQDI